MPAKTSAPSALSWGTLSPVMGAWLTAAAPPTTVPSTGIFSPVRTSTIWPALTSAMPTVRSRPSASRTSAVCGTEPISDLIEARARSVFNSAMNSAIRMITIRTAPATVSPPNTATRVAMVTKISVPILRSLNRSISPLLASG
ncbi:MULTISPECIES: hypothetical protein [unclassified Devosia]|uniref:hypothetical protein n=1 Tax=uncultured Devosia sp. TaxID=211434 RepID=UPI0025BB61CF|nr:MULTISPECIES: hypothetical protein [unclassified Devosia]